VSSPTTTTVNGAGPRASSGLVGGTSRPERISAAACAVYLDMLYDRYPLPRRQRQGLLAVAGAAIVAVTFGLAVRQPIRSITGEEEPIPVSLVEDTGQGDGGAPRPSPDALRGLRSLAAFDRAEPGAGAPGRTSTTAVAAAPTTGTTAPPPTTTTTTTTTEPTTSTTPPPTTTVTIEPPPTVTVTVPDPDPEPTKPTLTIPCDTLRTDRLVPCTLPPVPTLTIVD
jgi:hypothetical protein